MFRDVIDHCCFLDLGCEGPKFTFSRHFENSNSIWERLDRCLVTSSWFLKFLGTKVHHLRCDSSDHIPLHILLSGLDPPLRKKLFHSEEMWLSNRGCEEVGFFAWNGDGTFRFNGDVLAKIDKCGKDLTWWDKNVFGNVRRELDRLKKLQVKAKEATMANGNNFRIRQLKKEIDVLLDRESTMWAQRSRLLWVRNGDRNTRYFHARAQEGIEGIRWRVLEMREVIDVSSKVILLKCWLTTSRPFFLQVSRMGIKRCCHVFLQLLMTI